MNIEDIVWADFDVMCEITNCENENISIRVTAPEQPNVICGACGHKITNISAAFGLEA